VETGKPPIIRRIRRSPPQDVRLILYKEVQTLGKNGNSYAKIRREIEKRHRVRLSKATISGWITGKSSPSNAGHVFVPTKKPELAYVIGVKAGDASLNVKPDTYQYRIRLQAVDREFVEAFNHAVAKVLGCPPHRLWKGNTAAETHVEFGSYLLHKFLQQSLRILKPYIEHCRKCTAAFLRGFFDSEGCVDTLGVLTASNSDLELLDYVRYLLDKYFDIETTGPHLGTRKGNLITRRGKSYRRRRNCHSIYVRRDSRERFYRGIGLTIVRKSYRLEKSLGITESD